ncbi:hypothetical protein AVEN_176604-1 [Araneus ventricosus]|uniref:Uncharacterized protein n=1 Tax=Araneus ventricosus TaxID=182803 RepID=A0A4Y2EJL8_ARAVE|nr:hypothetical protein AVEN_176604-1 [Araneus ventricosus]
MVIVKPRLRISTQKATEMVGVTYTSQLHLEFYFFPPLLSYFLRIGWTLIDNHDPHRGVIFFSVQYYSVVDGKLRQSLGRPQGKSEYVKRRLDTEEALIFFNEKFLADRHKRFANAEYICEFHTMI